MKENRTVGPNLKSYYYYTNECAEKEDIKGAIVIASGMEGTGALFDEIGDYLDTKGYALYAMDELGYGKTGKIVAKTGYKNWRRKESYWAAYNIHGLVSLVKGQHPGKEVCLIGNDFGAMLSLYAAKEFPENIDKLITIGWGSPSAADFRKLLTSYIRKFFLFDFNVSKSAHFTKNTRLALHFETNNKYAWLTSDPDQIKKIRDAGFIDTPGTVGHYFFYYARKVKTPNLMKLKKCDKNVPMLFISGRDDLTTQKGRKTKQLAKHYQRRKFTNVNAAVIEGRHELLFEKNRLENVDYILNWIENGVVEKTATENTIWNNQPTTKVVDEEIEIIGRPKPEPLHATETQKKNEEIVIEAQLLKEADDDLRIKSTK